jgi:OCT family organic cation transporter-like MFS transporter 4/5
MFGKELRMQAGVCFMMFFSCGYVIMGVISFFVTDWRWYQIAITLPGLIFLTYWWFIPESVRWLLTKNKRTKAIIQIKKIAESNKVELPKEILAKFIESETQENGEENQGAKASVLDLFRQPHLRTKAVLIFMDWFVVSGAYYGLSWSSGDLIDGNPRLNHILSGLAEFPGYFILLMTLVS